MPRRFLFVLMLATGALISTARPAATPRAPNVLWITSEDHGPHMGCYGDPYATTPNVDRLAARGMIYTHAWSNAPVCAPARTTITWLISLRSAGAEFVAVFMKLSPKFLPLLIVVLQPLLAAEPQSRIETQFF